MCLNYGCGKGRALVVAATYPVRRVFGVEFLQGPAEIARDNIERARMKGVLKCSDVDVAVSDAATFAVPEDVTVIYLFNPLKGAVLASVQKQIYESLMRNLRRLAIVYMNRTFERNTFDDCEWLV